MLSQLVHVGLFDSYAAYGAAKITDLQLDGTAPLSKAAHMSVCGWGKCSGCTSHPSKPTKGEIFLEGVGIRYLGPIRQMSPYGGPCRRYFTDTKGQ